MRQPTSDVQGERQPPPEDAELYKAAAGIAKDTLDDQLAEVESIRQRSIQFLAFVGTATAFLVGTAAGGSAGARGVWFGVFGGAASIGMLALLLLLRSILSMSAHWYGGESRKFHYRQDASIYIEWLEKSSPSASAFYAYVTELYVDQTMSNKPYLHILRARYITFLVFSTLVLFAWGVLAWGFGGAA